MPAREDWPIDRGICPQAGRVCRQYRECRFRRPTLERGQEGKVGDGGGGSLAEGKERGRWGCPCGRLRSRRLRRVGVVVVGFRKRRVVRVRDADRAYAAGKAVAVAVAGDACKSACMYVRVDVVVGV